MTLPAPGLVEFTGPRGIADGAPLVVLGPALGTSVTHLYAAVVPLLAERFHVIGWDLPGHGVSDPAREYTLADLAGAVADAVTHHTGARSWHMVGTSIGGAVVQHLLHQDPGRVQSAALIATSNYFPDPRMWRERAQLVADAGTPTQVVGCARAWFAPDFLAAHPERGAPLLHDLQDADRFSYAAACRALGAFDLREHTRPAAVPTAVVAGAADAMVGPEVARALADALHAWCEIVHDAAHLVPVAAPELVAHTITELGTASR